jgi:hypothetical protein
MCREKASFAAKATRTAPASLTVMDIHVGVYAFQPPARMS